MFLFVSPTPLPTRGSHFKSACARRHAAPVRTKAPVNHAPLKMVLFDRDTAKAIRITGNNIHLTESLQSYVQDKLQKVIRRFPTLVAKMDVHLTVEHNPSVPNRHKAEVVAFAGKTILRAEVRSPDMYNSIDEVEERISRIIRKYKERKESKNKPNNKDTQNAKKSIVAPEIDEDDEETEDDQYADVYDDVVPPVPAVNEVVKRKVFPMPLQSVEEAVLCCEYVDHPWYLFRNAATGEISLVYKRNHGGYGLIEPSNPDAVDEEPL